MHYFILMKDINSV